MSRRVYTIGFGNNAPDGNNEAHRGLFGLLMTALSMASTGETVRLRTMREQFQHEISQRNAIEEDLAMIDTLEAGMRRDFGVRLAEKDRTIAERDRTIATQSQALAEQSQALIKKDQAIDTLNLGFKQQAEKIQQLEAEIARLKGDQM